MATINLKLLVLKSQLSDVDIISVCRTMLASGSGFLISVYGFLLKIFWFISKYLCRSKREHGMQENGSSFKANRSQIDDQQIVSKNSGEFGSSSLAEKESLELTESKKSKHSVENNEGTEGSVSLQSAIVANNSKYEFSFAKNVIGFMEEPKTMKFHLFVSSNDGFVSTDQRVDSEIWPKPDYLKVSSQHDLQILDDSFVSSIENITLEPKTDDQGKTEDPSEIICSEEIKNEKENGNSAEYKHQRDEEIASMEVESIDDQDFACEIELLPENQFSGPEIKEDSDNPLNENETLPANPLLASDAKQDSEDPGDEDEVFPEKKLSASDMKQDSDVAENEVKLHPEFLVRTRKVDESDNNVFFHGHKPRKAEDISTIEGSDDEYIELDTPMVTSKDILKEIINHGNSNKTEGLHEVESANNELRAKVNDPQHASSAKTRNSDSEELHEVESMQNEVMASMDKSQGESSKRNSWDSDSDDEDECDILLEHQHLVQQMKSELKNSKIRGLPTISEECETPKMAEDLKPLKIDLKFEYKDIMEEIHKFYKSYKERMRKLDILNYQTLHAISFLQLKDSEVFTSVKKRSALTLKPTWPIKGQRVYVDPTHKSIVEMHRDLELVYVGQLCLSWEILCWQYVKAKELLEYDAQGFHSFNRVAEEFQQFQVLVQRFMEDEPFQGPRIPNYVKNRCMIRSLLQVPIIKDDCLKDKKDRKEETDAISLELLTDIIKGSMLVFWEFLHSDKSMKSFVLNGVQGAKIHLQEPKHPELITDIITNLRKKERRLKEIARSQNCMVKKFQKQKECQLNNELFTSRVELRLISRVLSLSRLTTDQLVWCQKKLNIINFSCRKVHVEPLFLLFPC